MMTECCVKNSFDSVFSSILMGGMSLKILVDNADAAKKFVDAINGYKSNRGLLSASQDVTSSSVSSNVGQINEMAHDVEVGARQTSEAAADLARIANRASELVGRFKV